MAASDTQDDGFEAGEVFTGPEDCQIVLHYQGVRFIIVMIRLNDWKDSDIVESLFQKINEAENDPDKMTYHRCLEDVRETAIAACKKAMYKLASSVPNSNKVRSLDDFLHPTTFYLRLSTVEGHLQATKMDDVGNYVSMHQCVHISMHCLPHLIQQLIPASHLKFLGDLYMAKIIKVSNNGKACVFKSATYRAENQLKREIYTRQRMAERWGPDRDRPRIPRLLGLVTSGDKIVGILEEFVDGENLFALDLTKSSVEERRAWKMQIESTVKLLHQNGFVWGDVKPGNVLIDKSREAWLIDFGGEWTDGWVDEHLKQTVQGDMQGLQRVVQFLASGV